MPRWRALPDWLRQRPVAADALLAVGLAGAQLGLWFLTPRQLWPEPFLLAAGLTLAETTFVVVRRCWLWPAVVGVSAVAVATMVIPGADGGGGLGFLTIAYTASAYLRLRSAMLATLSLWMPGLVSSLLWLDSPAVVAELPGWYLLVWNALLALLVFFVGRAVHSRRAATAALASRARAAESTQRAVAEQAVADERRRIARELHDVVAHHVAVMRVLATGARRAASRDPAAADQALATIEETGRTALRELRRLLDVLRTEAEAAGELTPQPGLGGVATLVEQVREAGLPVQLQVTGDPGPLDPGVALTIYRVVQEALTNVLKHAGSATAEVRIHQDETGLRVEVTDTGRGPRPKSRDTIGHGLISMRERVALYGGILRTGPRAGGGFRVCAQIPAGQLTGEA